MGFKIHPIGTRPPEEANLNPILLGTNDSLNIRKATEDAERSQIKEDERDVAQENESNVLSAKTHEMAYVPPSASFLSS